MKRETLTRLIEAASPEQLRQIARLVLRLSGYPDSRITDGPYDGGTDLRVQSASGNSLPLAVALSVESDWQKKLRDDADKIKRKLGLTRLIFISSRRIPEGTFRAVQVELDDRLGVHVDRLDQQGITDLVIDNHKLSELLAILDIALDIGPQPSNPADRRRDAAYSYAFFSPDAQSFRAFVREQSLLVALAHAGGSAKLTDLYADAARLLGLPQEDVVRLLPDLERLLKQGRLRRYNGSVSLGDAEKATLDALRALDPLAVCELLSFVGGDGSRSETTRFVGFWLTELETEKGAQVLDTLVQLEKEQLSDAQLAQRARDFRAQYLAGRPDLSDVAALEQAWRSFRGQRR